MGLVKDKSAALLCEGADPSIVVMFDRWVADRIIMRRRAFTETSSGVSSEGILFRK